MRAFFTAVVWALALAAPLRAFDGAPRTAHFSTDNRDAGFVLDQTGVTPRVRFDGETEILAAWWQPAAGGDRILVRDDGVLILRQNVAGGKTLFSPRFPMGVPVGYDRPAMPLEGPPPPIETLRDTAREAAAQATEQFGATIRYEGDWELAAEDAGMRAVLFDAVQNAQLAMRMLALDARARNGVARSLRVVRFSRGPRPGVLRQRNSAIIVHGLEFGVAARPSSHRIAREIKAQFP
jgi:hypothetical protein